MVNLREIDGQPVAFGHQGAVWSDAMTLYDHLTLRVRQILHRIRHFSQFVERDKQARVSLVCSGAFRWHLIA